MKIKCLLIIGLSLCGIFTTQAQTILFDDFQRANNNTVGTTWVETESVAGTGATINSNLLRLGSATAGRDYVLDDLSTYYNTVLATNTSSLTWAFNMRQTRTDPSGFDASNYGVAFILGCSTTSFTSGTGYAVVLGNSGTSDNLRLVRFSNGLSSNAVITNIISPAVDYGADFLTIKVIYNPIGNNWSLYVGTNLASFDDPSSATYTQLGATTADNTYTSTDLLYMGCLYNHATSGTDYGYFDNVRIPACLINPEPTVQSSSLSFSAIGANSVTLNFTRGNGTECIIIAHQSGAVTTTPVDGNGYYSNTTFGSGALMAANEYVVYSGSASSVTITGLIQVTSYEFKIFEFNGTDCTTNYLLSIPATASTTTIACVLATEPSLQSSVLNITNVLSNSLDLSWTRGNGAYCIVLGKAASAISTDPADGTSYTASSTYSTGSNTGVGEYVLYSGTGNSVTITGISPSTQYYFKVFEMNGTGCNTNYLISSPASNNATTQAAVSYNYYYGNLHSHSDYSDGDVDNTCNGANSAYCCFDVGNTALNFDYMGISDHNHNEGPVMTPAKYASGLSEATSYNGSHSNFVALYGMEWGTISTGGHASVYGINQLVGWNSGNYNTYCAKGDYNTLFNLVASTPGAFVTLCHPSNTDYGNLLGSPYNVAYDNAIVGVAVRNGPAFSTNTTYTDPSTSTYFSFFKTMLSKGYHVGPTVDLDNHNSATMGKSSQQRTVLLATALNLSAIEDAILNMRFYSTDDYNINVSYSINSSIAMGSITAQSVNPQISVSVSDPDLESVSSIKIYYGIPGSGALPTVLTSVTNASALNYTHVIASGTYYYFAEITQADGGIAYTAPIWYTRNPSSLPITLLYFTGKHTTEGNLLQWTTLSEQNNDYFSLERSSDGVHFIDIATLNGAGNSSFLLNYSYLDNSYTAAVNYYRLKQTDYNKAFAYSDIVAVATRNTPSFVLYPNPGNGMVKLSNPNGIQSTFHVEVYDAMGKLVYASSKLTANDQSFDLSFLPKAIYSLVVSDNFTMQSIRLAIH